MPMRHAEKLRLRPRWIRDSEGQLRQEIPPAPAPAPPPPPGVGSLPPPPNPARPADGAGTDQQDHPWVLVIACLVACLLPPSVLMSIVVVWAYRMDWASHRYDTTDSHGAPMPFVFPDLWDYRWLLILFVVLPCLAALGAALICDSRRSRLWLPGALLIASR